MAKKFSLVRDSNGNPAQLVPLSDPHDIATGEQSNPIDGKVVRICAVDGAIRWLIGEDPEATAASHFLADQAEIYQPIEPGHKVSVYGGPANIGTAGI